MIFFLKYPQSHSEAPVDPFDGSLWRKEMQNSYKNQILVLKPVSKHKSGQSSSYHKMFDTISSQTGLPISTLLKIQFSMKKRDSYSFLQKFSNHPNLPSINTIIYKLLGGHKMKQRSFHSRAGTSMYQFSMKAPLGKVKISASIFSNTKFSLLSGKKRKDVITVKYTVTLGSQTISYKHLILLIDGQYIKSKHYTRTKTKRIRQIAQTPNTVKLLDTPVVVQAA